MFLSASDGAAQIIPLLEYRFNGTGTIAANTGSDNRAVNHLTMKNADGVVTDLHSASGLGVSGKPGDFAFNNTASTGMGSTGMGGIAVSSETTSALSGLQSFTISGWFKTDSTDKVGLGSRLLGFGPLELMGHTTIAGVLYGTANGSGLPHSGGNSFSDTGSWVFFAITYDGTATTNNVHYYKGTTEGDVTLVTTGSSAIGTINANSYLLTLGNTNGLNRPFDGYLDNIRVFGSKTDGSGALSSTQLETFRAFDVIPEPSSLAAWLTGCLVLTGARHLRLRRARKMAH